MKHGKSPTTDARLKRGRGTRYLFNGRFGTAVRMADNYGAEPRELKKRQAAEAMPPRRLGV